MNRLLIRVATGISTAAIVAYSFVGPALAVDVTVSGNGANSNNNANVTVSNSTLVNQSNTANINNNVSVTADTGKNDANSNTGGNVSVSTGDASAKVGVDNTANSNVANVSGCCGGDVNVTISGNGDKSKNTADVDVNKTKSNQANTWVEQTNQATVKNNVDVNLGSGNNDANSNTGGNVSITTGDASANGGVTIANAVNKNVASVGNGSNAGSLAVVISGNGVGSKNTADIDVAAVTGVEQTNIASIKNDVDVKADTGNNDAKDNTGGDVSITTGDAGASVDVSNMANFNGADVDSCGCILDATVMVKNNGVDSQNKADLDLTSVASAEQNNSFICDSSKPCNDVDVNLQSGNNDANSNTQGGEPEVSTGDAMADVVVGTTANSNAVGNVDSDFNFPEFPSSNGNSVSLMLLWLLAHFTV